MSRISTPRRLPSGDCSLSKFDSPTGSIASSSPWGPLAVQTLPAVRKTSYSHLRRISKEFGKDENNLTALWAKGNISDSATTNTFFHDSNHYNRTVQKRSSEQSLRLKKRQRHLRPFRSKLDLLDNMHMTSFNSNLQPPDDTDSIYIVEDYIPMSEDAPLPPAKTYTHTDIPSNSNTVSDTDGSVKNIHLCITCHKQIPVDIIFEKQYKNSLKIVCLTCIDQPHTKDRINASRILKIEPQALPGEFGSFSSTSSASSRRLAVTNGTSQTYFILENQPEWYERLQRRLRWRWRVMGLLK